MTEEQRAEITEERIRYYRMRMKDNHATPLFCIGIGHDHRSGQSILCLPDDVPVEVVAGLLRQALGLIEKAIT